MYTEQTPAVTPDSLKVSETTLVPGLLYVLKRDNFTVVLFNPEKVTVAITKAYLAVEGGTAAASRRVHETVAKLTEQITLALGRRLPQTGIIHVEDIQDQVELALMREGLHKVARSYVLYREERRRERDALAHKTDATAPTLSVVSPSGRTVPLDEAWLRTLIEEACLQLEAVEPEKIFQETKRNLYDGIKHAEIYKALVMSARVMIEQEPNYSFVASRLLLADLYQEGFSFLGLTPPQRLTDISNSYAEVLKAHIHTGIDLELLAPELRDFDLSYLGAHIRPERDMQFTYLGLQTLYDRYFIHSEGKHFELPQTFFMRVAMGLALQETGDRNAKTVEFYELLSSFDYMSSTPTLFNSGTPRSQLSSCYLTTVPDDLSGIYNAIRDNALLSKFAGGLGNDWTPVRAMNAYIKGTNGKSQGVVPFLKVANDTAVAVNQGGKRKGAVCGYLETWHLDIEEFLELRKNTGDERRRTPDMNTANWVPDLFMKRVMRNETWTLFSPNEVKDLHDLFGIAFEDAYIRYEAMAEAGEIKNFKQIPAVNLWRKMLGMIFETGHPWITFKDACNLRSPQQHAGVIHSSNLCTEITLNTSADEIAVCNLGSINLVQHTTETGLDLAKLEKTVHTAVRMLDNVIDINYYAVPQARRSNLRHRPVGLGIMGFQDALYKLNIPYASKAAIEFADHSMEAISYYAIQASIALAKERGSYSTFEGSLWSQGILPLDSLDILMKHRGGYLEVDRSSTFDWESVRQALRTHGIRNSNVMAIAPTATISNICGISQSIEPTYQNLFVKSNLSGEFTVINPYLVHDLKKLNLWDEVMVNDLKYFNGSVQNIDRIPAHLKEKYATAFEVDAEFMIEAASRRQKWIDQAQSLNLYVAEASGKKIDSIYKQAWLRGLKTTYYCRSLGATDVEKSTLTKGNLNAVKLTSAAVATGAMCSITDPTCEVCQ